MDFLNYVATQMFADNAVTSNPRNVQIYMNSIMADLYSEEHTLDRARLQLQGHIELAKHIQLFGDLDPAIED